MPPIRGACAETLPRPPEHQVSGPPKAIAGIVAGARSKTPVAGCMIPEKSGKDHARLFEAGNLLDRRLRVLQRLFRRDRAGDGLGKLDAEGIFDLRPLRVTWTRGRGLDCLHQHWIVPELLLARQFRIGKDRGPNG